MTEALCPECDHPIEDPENKWVCDECWREVQGRLEIEDE